MLEKVPDDSAKFTILNRLARQIFLRRVATIERGSIVLTDSKGRTVCGNPQADLKVQVQVHHPRFYRRMLLGGGLGAAEALMDGDWSCNDLTALVRVFIRNLEVSDASDQGLARHPNLE